MNAVLELRAKVAMAPLCAALGVSRATVHRRLRPRVAGLRRPTPARALDAGEKQRIIEVLCSERFVDRSPAEVVHTLLDEGEYLASERTVYRVLAERAEVRERRNQLSHPKHVRPELVATAPNEVWSWDITKLRTTVKWSYFYLYVVLDLFSRYVVGWMIARHESAAFAKLLLEQSVAKHGVEPGTVVLHSDRGPPMTSKTLAQLLADLDVARSFSRPHTSNDNPFSESQLRTVKYHPSFPGRFVSLEEALAWARLFFPWYNYEHHHSAIAYLTPADVYLGRADAVLQRRHQTLLAAYAAHPERFPNGPPKRQELAPATYINPPAHIPQPVVPARQTPSGNVDVEPHVPAGRRTPPIQRSESVAAGQAH